MIEVAVISLLVILVIANVGLSAYNSMYPPCETSKDYFDSARTLPDGAIAGLGSIPSGTDLHYVGAATVATGQSGVIGLTNRLNTIVPPEPVVNKKLFDALENMFSGRSDEQTRDAQTKTKRNKYGANGPSGIFEDEMEGLKANNDHVSADRVIMKPSGFVRTTKTDGYSERRPNDF